MPSNKIWLGTTGDLATAGNYSASGVPAAGDSLRVQVGSGNITASLSALSTGTLSGSLATVIFEDGCAQTVGTTTAPMKFTATRFDGIFSGGQQFFDLEASAISIRVKAGSGGTGQFGTYIKGSALATIDIEGGYVAVAGLSFETATATAIRVVDSGANVFIGEGVSLTTLEVAKGTCDLRCAATTVYNWGTLTTWGSGAITTVNQYAGTLTPESTGTITAINLYGGTVDLTTSGAARTVTTINFMAGGNGVLLTDTGVITHTNAPALPANTKIQIATSVPA